MTFPVPRAFVSLLLCTGLLLPGLGVAAQTPGEARPLPGTQNDAPRRLLVDESEGPSRPADRDRIPIGVRMVAEVGGGLIAATALTLGGGIVGGLLCLVTDTDYSDAVCFVPLFLGVVGGATFGLPLGAWWVGERLGGDGSLLVTLGGGIVGALAGTGVLLAARALDPSMTKAQPVGPVLAIPILSVVGCAVAYELFQREPRALAARRGLQPLLSFTPGGAVVGLGGQF